MDPSNGTERSLRPPQWLVVVLVWLAAATPFAVVSCVQATRSGRPLIVALTVLGVLGGVGALEGWRRGSTRAVAAGLAVSAISMPTGFAAFLNVAAFIVALVMAVRSR